jgi:hypothetical protein
MAQDLQITCIKKTNRYDPHERIHSIGGTNPDWTPWRLTVNEAILGIYSGKWEFHTGNEWSYAKVIVATHNGHMYLKTVADDIHPNNLLELPECS